MKYTLPNPIKVLEISEDTLFRNGVDPSDRKAFLKEYEDLLVGPSDEKVLDLLDVLTHELDTSFSAWNVRWVDIIGETQYVDHDSKDEYLEHIRLVNQLMNEYLSVPWYRPFKQMSLDYRIEEVMTTLPCKKSIYQYNSFRREWFLDIYY